MHIELTDDDLHEFIAICKRDFGEDLDLSREEARVVASRLLTLYAKLMEPLPSEIRKREADEKNHSLAAP